MRITGGDLKGQQLPAKFAKHVRPTTDRVRESLFNHLVHNYPDVFNQVLDLYSGSGIIALECLSRQSPSVTSVDMDFVNIQALQNLKKQLNLPQWQIIKGKAETYVSRTASRFSFIFADPPYALSGVAQLPTLLLPLLAPQGVLVIEHQPHLQLNSNPTLIKNYGSTICSIFVQS